MKRPTQRRAVKPSPPAREVVWQELSSLGLLPAASRETLFKWLTDDHLSCFEGADKVREQWGLEVSPVSLSQWLVRQCFAQDVRASALLASDLQADLESLPLDLDVDLISRASQAKFEVEIAQRGDIKDHIALRRLRQTDRAHALAERALRLRASEARRTSAHRKIKLKLERQKFEFDAAQAALDHLESLRAIAADRSLPSQQKLDAIRGRLFGAPPEIQAPAAA
jgi:hypothetical protein